MIDLYTWSTPNGRKASIMLAELGVPYEVKPIDIGKNEQFGIEFLTISPNNKIPAIVDHESGVALMESGAILLYLAEKYRRFLPQDHLGRWSVVQWLMWQMGGLGPTFGQVHNFVHFNPGKAPFAEERFTKEALRLYGVLEKQLANRDFVAESYSIADIAIWPWVSRFEWQKIDLSTYPNVKAWYKRIAERPGVQRGYHTPSKVNEIPMP